MRVNDLYVFSIRKVDVSAEEAIDLYVNVGWGNKSQYSKTLMVRALKNSSFVVSVRNSEGRLIGLTRCLSDMVIFTTIADIVVHSEYQNLGIGYEMVTCIQKKFEHTSIFVHSLKTSEPLFRKCNFKKSNMSVFSKK